MKTKSHWEHIYKTNIPTQVSWYQEHSQLSMQFIQNTAIRKTDHIIDVGGGTSTLVDDLIDSGFQHVTVLDISATALKQTRERLGTHAADVNWIEADITQVNLPHQTYDLWHDRAVFHFLTLAVDRQQYITTVRQAVRAGGHVIIATFALEGPERCSGLDVLRYSPENLQSEFGKNFELVDSARETHHTPFGREQKFIYCYCRKY